MHSVLADKRANIRGPKPFLLLSAVLINPLGSQAQLGVFKLNGPVAYHDPSSGIFRISDDHATFSRQLVVRR